MSKFALFAVASALLLLSQPAAANTGVPVVAFVGADVVGYTFLVTVVEAAYIRRVLKKRPGRRLAVANSISTLAGLGIRVWVGLPFLTWWLQVSHFETFRSRVLSGLYGLLILAFPLSCAIEWAVMRGWFQTEGVERNRALRSFLGSQTLSYALLAVLLPFQLSLPTNMEFAPPRAFMAPAKAVVYFWGTEGLLHRAALDGKEIHSVPNVKDACLTEDDVKFRFQIGHGSKKGDPKELITAAGGCLAAMQVRPNGNGDRASWINAGSYGAGEWVASQGILGNMLGFVLSKSGSEESELKRVRFDAHAQLTYLQARLLGLTDDDVLVFQLRDLIYVWALRAGKIGLLASDVDIARLYFTSEPQ